MTRHLITLFALFSGLAALTGSANASIADALNCDIGVAADADHDSVSEARDCSGRPTMRVAYRKSEVASRSDCVDEPNYPSVLFGIDRAYE
ncbi:MAG: hypothetical protein ABJP48_08855 [Erythrobacter sp.]